MASAHSGALPPAPHGWHRRARPLLGTLVEVSILCADAAADAGFFRLGDLAFACIARYHAAMSFHEAGSDLRRIASAAAGTTLQIAAHTWEVIAAALAFEAESGGVFNVAVAAALVDRGRLPAPPEGTGSRHVNAPAPASASACLALETGSRITVLHPVWIDLGGIAKGAAVDAALAELRTAGAAAAIVNAGGDMAMYGAHAHPITVRGPGGILVEVGSLADAAIATSGPFDDAARSALVLRSGDTARWAERSVSVVAPTCLVADALTKVLASLGPDAAPLLARHGARGFSVDAAGRLEHAA